MDKFIPSDKHIFTEKMLGRIDIGVIYTSMIASKESIFVFGGDHAGLFTPSAEVRRYDVANKSGYELWYKLKEMPHYLWGATAQIVDDKIFIMGGGRQSTYESYNLVYDIKSNSWEEKAGLPISRKGLVSGVINDIIYIACGYQMWGAYNITPYCYAYNPKTDTWKQCHQPLSNRAYAMSAVVDNCLYVLGGYGYGSENGECIKMERYCPETDSWETMPGMLRPRINAVAVAIDRKIFILCGSSLDDYITMDYYDTITRKWTISDIPTPELISPGVAVIDNKIYLTAGINRNEEYNRILYEITYGGMKE